LLVTCDAGVLRKTKR